MDHKGLAALIVRTGGLVLIIFTLADFPAYFEGYVRQPDHSGYMFLGMLVLPIGIPLAVGILLMSIPGKISWVVSGAVSEETAIPKQLQALIFAGIGLYIALKAVLDLVWYWGFFRYAREIGAANISVYPKEGAGLYTAFAGLAMGILLILGANGLSTLIYRLRNANKSVSPPTE